MKVWLVIWQTITDGMPGEVYGTVTAENEAQARSLVEACLHGRQMGKYIRQAITPDPLSFELRHISFSSISIREL